MKSANSLIPLAIAIAVVAFGAGCKKTPKNPTFIPPVQRGNVADANPGGPLRLGTGQTGATVPGGGLTGDGSSTGSNLPGGTSRNLDPNDPANKIQGDRPPEGSLEDDKTFANDKVLFSYDSAAVRGSEVAKVQRVAAFLKNDNAALVRVEGNCDERGTEEYNRSLGERRALAVRELLVAEGVAPERVTTVSYGEDKPIEQGHDEAAWQANRRAEFIVLRPPGAATTGIQ